MDRYRVYLRPGTPADAHEAEDLESAAARGGESAARTLDASTVRAVLDLALGQASPVDQDAADEFVVRFQQTCGPAMAKAIEDTAYYRYVRLVALNEVGGDPTQVGVAADAFHSFAANLLASWPQSMTDAVDARHQARRGRPGPTGRPRRATRRVGDLGACGPRAGWPGTCRRARRAHRVLPVADAGRCAGRSVSDRLHAYALKAMREVEALHALDRARRDLRVGRPALRRPGSYEAGRSSRTCESWLEATMPETRANVLGQKLVQLDDARRARRLPGHRASSTSPWSTRTTAAPSTTRERRDRLARLDRGGAPADLHDEKLLVTSAALRTRRERPAVFTGEDATYVPLATTSEHAVAFGRGTDEGDRGRHRRDPPRRPSR